MKPIPKQLEGAAPMKLPLWMRIVMWSLRAVELPPVPLPPLPTPPTVDEVRERVGYAPLFEIKGIHDVAAVGALFTNRLVWGIA